MKTISGKKFCKLLETHGWILARINGSHYIYIKSSSDLRISVPVHKNDDLKLVINLTDSVSSEEYAIAMRKEDTELLAQINEALQTIKDNGTYDALISKYFGE